MNVEKQNKGNFLKIFICKTLKLCISNDKRSENRLEKFFSTDQKFKYNSEKAEEENLKFFNLVENYTYMFCCCCHYLRLHTNQIENAIFFFFIRSIMHRFSMAKKRLSTDVLVDGECKKNRNFY